jgi:hypothetical protein
MQKITSVDQRKLFIFVRQLCSFDSVRLVLDRLAHGLQACSDILDVGMVGHDLFQRTTSSSATAEPFAAAHSLVVSFAFDSILAFLQCGFEQEGYRVSIAAMDNLLKVGARTTEKPVDAVHVICDLPQCVLD